MSAFEVYISKLVNGESVDDGFPKNESSWEELFEFGKLRIDEIVSLRQQLARLRLCEQSLAQLQRIEAAAIKFLPKRHLSGCTYYRFSDGVNRRCSCGRDELAAALEAK